MKTRIQMILNLKETNPNGQYGFLIQNPSVKEEFWIKNENEILRPNIRKP